MFLPAQPRTNSPVIIATNVLGGLPAHALHDLIASI
jgi:hypothetical protein